MKEQNKINNFEKIVYKVSTISIIVNVLLSIFKLFAGFIANSSAMISDAVHSASDVFSTIVVIIGVKLASKKSDKEHPYGHERLECIAAIILAMILFMTGCMIGFGAIQNIIIGNYDTLKVPGKLALFAAIFSILTKEVMYWYTRINAKKIDSGALMADAWHHRSDALSSIGALIGIAGSRMGYPIMDSIASLIIFIFIIKAAFDIFKDDINKLVDHSCDDETEEQLYNCVLNVESVEKIDLLKTRLFGNKIYVDIEIALNENYTLREAHEIANKVHDMVEDEFPKVKHVMVHINPLKK